MSALPAYHNDDFFPATDADDAYVAVRDMSFNDERTMTFMASMPGFAKQLDTARVLPITPIRFDERLDILEEGAEFVRDFEKSLFGFSSAADEMFLYNSKRAMTFASMISERTVRATQFLVEQRLLVGLIRRSVRGDGLPDDFAKWYDLLPEGIYEIAKRNKKAKDLGLGVIYPYLLKLIDHLEKDQAILAEEQILRMSWATISDMAFLTRFDMEAVLLYVMRWHILRQWLARRPDESLKMINTEIDKVFEKTEIKL